MGNCRYRDLLAIGRGGKLQSCVLTSIVICRRIYGYVIRDIGRWLGVGWRLNEIRSCYFQVTFSY